MTGPLPVTRFRMRGKQTVEAALSLDLPGKRTRYMHMRLSHTLRVEGSFSKRKQEEPAARARWPMPRTSRVQRLAASPVKSPEGGEAWWPPYHGGEPGGEAGFQDPPPSSCGGGGGGSEPA